MTVTSFLVLLLVAGICGAVGQAIVGYSHGGCLVSVGVGLIGAVLGMFVAQAAGLPSLLVVNIGATPFPIVWAILGSVLFVALLALVRRGST